MLQTLRSTRMLCARWRSGYPPCCSAQRARLPIRSPLCLARSICFATRVPLIPLGTALAIVSSLAQMSQAGRWARRLVRHTPMHQTPLYFRHVPCAPLTVNANFCARSPAFNANRLQPWTTQFRQWY